MQNLKKILIVLFTISAIFLFTGCSDGKTEIHHVFPQQFRAIFQKAGIDVDQYGLDLTRLDHRTGEKALHKTAWNKEWNRYLKANPNATKSDLVNQMKKMLKNNGFLGAVEFRNYRTKEVTTALVLTQNKFIDFATTIGQWLTGLLGGTSIGATVISFFAFVGTSVLGFFGIKAGHPATVGIGFIVIIFSLIGLSGIVYLIWYLYPAIIAAIGVIFATIIAMLFGG